MAESIEMQRKLFVEEVGLTIEELGISRMAGRIFGCLLVADPPHQSLNQLADYLEASKGSVSTMTRVLIQLDLIERFALPNDRRDYYRIRKDVWTKHLTRMETKVAALRILAEKGLRIAPVNARYSLEEMRDFHAFLEKQHPEMLENWHKRNKVKKISEARA